MRLRFLLSATVLSTCMTALPVLAQDAAVYERDGYDRLVIDGIAMNPAETMRADDRISFALAAVPPALDGGEERQVLIDRSDAIGGMTLDDGTLTIAFSGAVTSARYFNIADRLIVDLFISDRAAAEVPPAPSTPSAPAVPVTPGEKPAVAPLPPEDIIAQETPENPPLPVPENDNRISLEDLAEQGLPADESGEETEAETEPEAAPGSNPGPQPQPQPNNEPVLPVVEETAPVLELEESAPPPVNEALADPTIISLSSTTPFGLAAFKRYDRLFIVIDQTTMQLPPQIAGAGARLGWDVREIPMDNEKAWVVSLPSGAFVRPEGGGLVWRLVVSDVDPDLETAEIARHVADSENPSVDILLEDATRILRLQDPDYGDDLAVVTMPRATARMGRAYDFIDFDVIPAVVGAVIKPETDGLRLSTTGRAVTVTKDGGLDIAKVPQDDYVERFLAAMNDGDTANNRRALMTGVKSAFNRIYYFGDWGAAIPPHQFIEKRKRLDQLLAQSASSQKVPVLLDMAKLTLSQGMAPESLGYLRLARDADPQLAKTPEFISLNAAAHFLSRHYDAAIPLFASPNLAFMPEIKLWLAAAHAAKGDLQKAMETYPGNANIAASYPPKIRIKVIAPLAAAFLDSGQGETARELVALIDIPTEDLGDEGEAALAYLKGRAQKMTGRPDEAISSLYKAAHGDKLGPYGARSELLLVEDDLAREVITADEAIKRLERLRFAWRGDELETEIYKKLGMLYIDNNQLRRGLTILKTAAENSRSVADRRTLVRLMADTYKNMFLAENFENLDPLEAVTVYAEFKELTPVGEEGNRIIDRIADKLMEIDLMGRAASLLKDKMERLGGGKEAIRTGLRVAAIQLVDRKPAEAMETLEIVDGYLRQTGGGPEVDAYNEKAVMLKARALSDQGQAENALFMLEGLPETNEVLRLRVDTAWRDGNWIAVSENLDALIARETITPETPPTDEQARMILNQAIALNLSDQQAALQAFAAQYDTAMKQTPAYKTFQLVTLPSGIATLADRNTMTGLVSEVDLFQEYLDSLQEKPAAEIPVDAVPAEETLSEDTPVTTDETPEQ